VKGLFRGVSPAGGAEGRDLLDVLLDLVCVRAAVDVYFFNTAIGKELKGVFDQWGVDEGEETSRLFEREGTESCLERIRKNNGL